MHVGMSIDPDYAQPDFGICHPDARYGSHGNAMISPDHDRKLPQLQGAPKRFTHPFGHGQYAGDPLGIPVTGRLEKQMVFIGNRNPGITLEKPAAEIERSDADRVRPQTGAARPRPYLRPHFY